MITGTVTGRLSLHPRSGLIPLLLVIVFGFAVLGHAQVISGSNGSDGAFNPTNGTVINMADHPDGIYQYTSVNIAAGVTIFFTPNASNTPVTWLVQSNCVITGTINLDGKNGTSASSGGQGGSGGPGGWAGGNAGSSIVDAGSGFGPGGGQGGLKSGGLNGGSAGYGIGSVQPNTNRSGGAAYGNIFLLPIIGGSGGGGSCPGNGSYNGPCGGGIGGLLGGGGGGGGGAICIAVSGSLNLNGSIRASGGCGFQGAGAGSAGAIRLIASSILGSGSLNSSGSGTCRIRIDAVQNNFYGTVNGAVFTQGYQPIILPAGQQPNLSIISVAGLPAPSNPTGSTATPDVLIAGQAANPIAVVVQCSNLALNSTITLRISPQTAAEINATALNSTGSQASSTATFYVNMPHGGGVMYAQCVTGVMSGSYSSNGSDLKYQSLAQTGWSATGERFVSMELTAELGKAQKLVYITESGKRFPVSAL